MGLKKEHFDEPHFFLEGKRLPIGSVNRLMEALNPYRAAFAAQLSQRQRQALARARPSDLRQTARRDCPQLIIRANPKEHEDKFFTELKGHFIALPDVPLGIYPN